MLEKVKNLFSDNYKVLSLITTIYVVFLYLINIKNIDFDYSRLSKDICDEIDKLSYYFDIPFDNYSFDTGVFSLTWIVFIFSIWTIVKLFKTKPQSSLILYFMFLALYFNPIHRVILHNDVCLFLVTTMNTFLITVYNWNIFKEFGSIIKEIFVKFARLFMGE